MIPVFNPNLYRFIAAFPYVHPVHLLVHSHTGTYKGFTGFSSQSKLQLPDSTHLMVCFGFLSVVNVIAEIVSPQGG